MRTMCIAVLLCCFACASLAQSFEHILVPIAINGELSGAYGSRWKSELSVTNTSSDYVQIFGYAWAPDGCSILCSGPPSTPPNITFTPIVGSGLVTQGTILLVDRQAAPQVRFQLRVRDTSRESQNWGTEIPIVREAGLRTSSFELLDVPLRPNFRQQLRIYDVAATGGSVTIRFYRTDPSVISPVDPIRPTPPADRLLLTLAVATRVERRSANPIVDLGYVDISNLASLAELQGSDRIRIQIVPSAGAALWAFVSVTNNDTQQVTAITPQ